MATVYSADIEKLKEGVLAVTHRQEVPIAFERLHFGVSLNAQLAVMTLMWAAICYLHTPHHSECSETI